MHDVKLIKTFWGAYLHIVRFTIVSCCIKPAFYKVPRSSSTNSQFILAVTNAISDDWHNGDIFPQSRQKNLTQRYPASMADKQSGFPELNGALRHLLYKYR